MDLVYYGEDLPEIITRSIFLGGVSSRNLDEVPSWRPDALKILEDIGFEDGLVFIPEYRNDKSERLSYEQIVEWEEKHLHIADCIIFWLNRDLSLDSKGNAKNLGLISNVEIGKWIDSGKTVLGFPENAEKTRYQKYYAEKYNVPI